MSDKTGIEWTDATWSPVTGCTRISDGCTNCYIERTPPFRMAHRRFDQEGIGGTTGVQLHHDRMLTPMRWRKPRKVFVCSMADLFHDHVPESFIGSVFDVMAKCERHTFQVLTKRPARMRALLTKWATQVPDDMPQYKAAFRAHQGVWAMVKQWPLPNVWLGVSAEDQKRADLRIPALLDTPAAVRFVSAEPLLGPIDLHTDPIEAGSPFWGSQLDWVIVGGESGPGARPMHPDWARSLRDQCVAAGVPFLFKQWGEYRPLTLGDDEFGHYVSVDRESGELAFLDGDVWSRHHGGRWEAMRRVGKKRAGRELDGRTWDQYPEAVA